MEKEDRLLTTRQSLHCTIITIKDYDKWVSFDQMNGQTVDTLSPDSSQMMDTNKSVKKVKKEKIDNKYFNEFWDLYPRKRGKQNAYKIYAKLLKQDTGLHQAIISSLKNQDNELFQRPTQYIPYPATWLNQKGWEDEIEMQSKIKSNQTVTPPSGKYDSLNKQVIIIE